MTERAIRTRIDNFGIATACDRENDSSNEAKMKRVLAGVTGLFWIIAASSFACAQAPLNNVILGHSGGVGSLGNLRKIIERDKLWEKYGLSVKSVYFSSGGVLTQAMAGGNIAGSESE